MDPGLAAGQEAQGFDITATDMPHTVTNSNRRSPLDEVDLVPNLPPMSREGRSQNGSDKPQGEESSSTSVLTHNGPPPHSRLDTRGLENEFRFAAPPRHAPGHFTSRKIVQRVNDQGAKKQSSHQLPSSNVLKGNRDGMNCASPPQKPPHNHHPGQFPSFAPSPRPIVRMADGTHKQSVPPKKISLPFANNQPSTALNICQRTAPEKAQQTGQETIHANPQRLSSESPASLARPSVFKQHEETGNEASEVASPVSAQMNHRREDRQQTLEDIVEQSDDDALAAEEPFPSEEPAARNHRQPTIPVQAQVNGQPDPMNLTANPQITRSGREEQPDLSRPAGPVFHGRDDSRSPSGSSTASGIPKRMSRSLRQLHMYREQDLPVIADKLNGLWSHFHNVVKEADRKVDKCRKKLHERSQEMATYLETINHQAQAIRNLEGEKRTLHDSIAKLQSEVQLYSGKTPELVNKCRAMKDTLNSAMKETQDQRASHIQYQKASQKAIDEIRAEKMREQFTRETVERQLASVRDQLKEKVRQVEEKSQEQLRRMTEQLQVLDSQARREREIAEQLSKQLEEHSKAQASLEDVQGQTAQIFRMLSERDGEDRMDEVKSAQIESKAKLESMAEYLESLRALLVPQGEAVSVLTHKQEDGISRIMSSLQALEEREQERQSLETQLQQSNDARNLQEEHMRGLVQKIEELEAQLREDFEAKVRSQALNTENDKLRTELATKYSRISDLETQLAAKNENYMTEVDRFGREVARLTQLLNEREEASKSATDRTMAIVQEECRAKLQHLQEEMRQRLQQAENDRLLVVTQLDETKKKLADKEQDASDNISSLQQALDAAELRTQELTKEGQQKDLEAQALRADLVAAQKANTEMQKEQLKVKWPWRGTDTRPSPFVAQGPVQTGQSDEDRVAQPSFNSQPPSDQTDIFGAALRRVTVQSPHPGVLTPTPLSVEQEQSRRRGNLQQPRPIIKRVTRSSANAEAPATFGQDSVPASNLLSDYNSFLRNPFTRPSNSKEAETNAARDNGREGLSGAEQRDNTQGPTSGQAVKIKLKNSKRPRKTSESEPVGPFSSPVRPERDDDPFVDDEDVPQSKRTKVQKPKAPATSRRGKQKPKPLSGLSAPGVVHGSFPPGVVQGGFHPASEPKDTA